MNMLLLAVSIASTSALSSTINNCPLPNSSKTICDCQPTLCDDTVLEDLEELNLSHMGLTGSIPPQLGNATKFPNLKVLRLANTITINGGHSGPIPPELGNLANLRELDLGWNNFTGPIPPELGKLANLRKLELSWNQLTGPIPPELGNLANLRKLDLRNNQLTGPIPPELGNLANLESLNLNFKNRLTGPIPPELGNLANLKELDLGWNQLTGPIPPELGNLANLESLYLHNNQLTGPIPSELLSLSNLVRCYIGGTNHFCGSLPWDDPPVSHACASDSLEFGGSCNGDGGAPCFGRDNTAACRLLDGGASAAAAHSACWGADAASGSEVAALVPMSELVAGDLIITEKGGAPHVDRVVINQHRQASAAGSAVLLTIVHALGSLTLTPNHILWLEGAFMPARAAVVGSALSNGLAVTAITKHVGGIVNPIVARGTILASDMAGGVPVLAATADEWMADVLLSEYSKYSPSCALAAGFPEVAQAYYDDVLESLFNGAVPALAKFKATAPAPLVCVALVAGDAALAIGLGVYALGLKGAATLAAAVLVGVATRRAARK